MSSWKLYLEDAVAISVVVGVALLSAWINGPWFGFALCVVVVIVLGRRRLEKLAIGVRDGKIEALFAKVEQASTLSKDAKMLAQLSVEIGFWIGNLPRGVIGGGNPASLDGLRKKIAQRLAELGFDRATAASFAQFDDPAIYARLIKLIRKDLSDLEGGSGPNKSQMREAARRSDEFVKPDALVEAIDPSLREGGDLTRLLEIYREWYESEARLFTVVEHMDEIRTLEQRSADKERARNTSGTD